MSKKKNKKIYEKALSLYNRGYIDESINLCEKGISKDLNNSNIVNLKGLLLYLKGNLKEAIALWKINKDYNNDVISKTYLKDIEKDFKREELYKESEELINKLLIDDAIEKLLECSKSDFNLININNALAICYLRKGQYENSLIALEKVFITDKNNINAKEIQKEVNDILNIKSKDNHLLKVMILILVAVVSIMFIRFTIISKERKNNIENNITTNENKGTEINPNNKSEDKENINGEDKENTKKEEKMKEELIELTSEEISKNYKEGTALFGKGKYKEAKEILEYTLKPSEGNYLNDDILFFLASSSEKAGDLEDSIKYFEEFILKYNNGNYIEESYYKISLLYKDKDKDIEKSKYYAKELISRFPRSIYINKNIKEILAS
ncbi:tetratricopeptide repeat protein [Clostridium sp.]|uniref:tetratricopeptide repeat protein n=1 Tax=Clostridium sp. TaxID=1506 RepID=UPI002634E30D|nr:tetratricopeptide repeat protein [Clostridium sp.]